MSDMTRVQRWRTQQRAAGKDALTIWLPRELKLYVEDIALKRHCSPSDLIAQALTTCYPLSADMTDTSQLRLVLQQELQALLYESQQRQEAQPLEGVTDTVTDTITVMSQLRMVVEQAVWESMDKWQQSQHLQVVPIVTDTDTDTGTLVTTAPASAPVTDTVTDTQDTRETEREAMPLTPPPRATDTVTDTGGVPPFHATKHRLGKLCKAGHDYHGTGKSLRVNNKAGGCLACDAEKARERRQAKRQRVSV